MNFVPLRTALTMIKMLKLRHIVFQQKTIPLRCIKVYFTPQGFHL
jgi:hypothetical protein